MSDRTGASWLRRYDRLHLHTTRQFSGLAHWAIPRMYPRYLSRDEFAEYLQAYSKQLGVDVVYNCNVERIERVDSRFALTTNQDERAAEIVVVATGMFGEPVTPSFDGLENFRGRAIHASAYVSPENLTPVNAGRSPSGRRSRALPRPASSIRTDDPKRLLP